MEVERPILRYHGGKWRIAKWIIEQMPAHRTYIEPFCGAASILLRKPKSTTEVINDLNSRLISVFKVLRCPEKTAKLKQMLIYTPYSFQEQQLAREVAADPVEDARRMIILGHQSFGSCGPSGGKNTGWRRGIRKDRNTSSADEWKAIEEHILSWSNRLRSVFIENESAIATIQRWDNSDSLFYVDPPYVASSRYGAGNRGYAHEMTDEQHIELADLLHNVKGKVILSGYKTDLYDRLYSDWRFVKKRAMADRGKAAKEYIWFSFKEENSLF